MSSGWIRARHGRAGDRQRQRMSSSSGADGGWLDRRNTGRAMDQPKRRRLNSIDKGRGVGSVPGFGDLERRPLPPLPDQLTREQRGVIEAVHAGYNVFFTGCAGTGKSHVLQLLRQRLPEASTFVTASTGVAAVQVGGTTLHSFAGVYDTSLPTQQLLKSAQFRRRNWCNAEVLIVDEVSMIDAEMFTKLDWLARTIRNDDRVFGGIQLVLCGDFFQLPPVTRRGDLTDNREFLFQSPVWQRCQLQLFQLSRVFRQRDQAFVDVLDDVRFARCSDRLLEMLQRVQRPLAATSIPMQAPGSVPRHMPQRVVPTMLRCRNVDVDRVNEAEMRKLPGEAMTFAAQDQVLRESDRAMLQTACLAPERLSLKQGAQVMLVQNLAVARGLVNGSRGVVIGFNGIDGMRGDTAIGVDGESVALAEHDGNNDGDDDNDAPPPWPLVQFACRPGVTYAVHAMPLKLAWCITVHKSQGMTLDAVEIDLADVFEAGQVYTALSRARGIDGLRVRNFVPSSLRADPRVVEFYAGIKGGKESRQSP